MLLLSEHASQKPKFWFWLSTLISFLLIVLVALPTLAPSTFTYLHPLKIDTDPENMLSVHEPVRTFHNAMKREFNLSDVVVVGVTSDQRDSGVFNQKSLTDIYELASYAQQLQWQDDHLDHGVVAVDLIAPSTVDNIEQAGVGTVRFEWLMSEPPKSDEEALKIAEKAQRIPFLNNTLIDNEGKALALYIPIVHKSDSYEVAQLLREKIAEFDSGDTYYITGLPVAQDQFGVEMFKQMAISAPMAMLLIFLLMWYFFRHINLIIAPMIVSLISVIVTMTLLIITGHTVHIMSSMIPIFIMPIAVLDAVHILSDFFDRYPSIQDRYKATKEVMEELSKPMLFTSLTTCAGFASLAFTPIPPVQTFGIFIAIGVFFAWIFTVTLVPAYIMLLPEKSLESFGMKPVGHGSKSLLEKSLEWVGRITHLRAKRIIVLTLALAILACYGITKIEINDNPVKWFEKEHPIRVADQELNKRFAGTYMAYLALQAPEMKEYHLKRKDLLQLPPIAQSFFKRQDPIELSELEDIARLEQSKATSDEQWEMWDEVAQFASLKLQETELFKNPKVLSYIEQLQQYLLTTGLVGKSNGLTDIIKTVHRELYSGDEEALRIPETSSAVAQTLMTYQGSHRPGDLWHFVTPDYRKTNLWIQLKSGDNKDMQALVNAVNQFCADYPPPFQITHNWFGLTYINVIWQDKMVSGMLESFIGSFVIVLAMMIFLFRSISWGILSMIPLTVTIGAIYGFIGLIGKDYDMPVAVLSSLSLGLAVDYAIHFLARARQLHTSSPSWQETLKAVFGEPGRAIVRNVIVIGVGFLPLLAAPLVPYQTVGAFISAILVIAGAASLLILPALITLMEKRLFKRKRH